MLVAALLVAPQAELMAYSTSYVVEGQDIVQEKPEKVFKKPYCFYQGQDIEIWGEKECGVNLPMEGDAAKDILVINKGTSEVFLVPVS